jgi:TRAP-type mannitol/chloroaromatic compound transport system permease small subunit
MITLGRGAAWLTLGMALVGAWNAVARHLSKHLAVDLSSNAFIELQWYMFSLVFLLCAAYTLRRDEHVRVDVLYSRLRPRAQAWVDIIGTTLLLLPFCLFGMAVTAMAAWNSVLVLEGSPDPDGLPRYPLKVVVPVSFLLLAAEGVRLLRRRWAELR